MKVAFLLEDRDTAWVFLDPTNAPDEVQMYEFKLDGVRLDEAEDDDKSVWLSTDTSIRVVPRDTVDFDKHFNDAAAKEWPIPSCIICLDKDDETYKGRL